MNKKSTILSIVLFAATLLAGCKGFLDSEPVSQAVAEKFWNNENEAEVSVNGGYALLRDAFTFQSSYFAYGDLPTDEFRECEWPYSYAQTFNLQQRFAASDADNPLVNHRKYTNFYRVIDQANNIIANVPGIADKEFDEVESKKNLLGEGYFLRAFTYFYITRIWGDVPLVLAPNEDILKAQYTPRVAKETVYAQINSDLTKAVTLLPDENRGLRGSRANKAVAYALKAHLAAWLGNYQACVSALDSAETGAYGYGPRDRTTYLNRFHLGNTEDNVFFIPRLLSQNESTQHRDNAWGDIGFQTGAIPYHPWRGDPMFTLEKARVLALFPDSADVRRRYGFQKMDDFAPLSMKYLNMSWAGTPDESPTRYSYVINVFRYTELRLLKAEALAFLNKTGDAKTILNEVREVNGLQPWDESGDLYEAVMEERARELFLEGHRFYDLVRMAKYKNSYQFPFINEADFKAGKYYWPVDPTLFNNDPTLKQTPFWNGKL